MIQVTAIHYPESDGKPMGETDIHRDEMVRQIELLRAYYAGQRVYVSGNLLVYYERGNPKKFVVPDCLVAKGLSPKKRRTYKTWVEGKTPDVMFETTSRKTKKKDSVDKLELYARLGVKEYFLFDPEQDYLDPPLQGYRLVDEAFAPIELDAEGYLPSLELDLLLRVDADSLEFYHPIGKTRLLTADERAQLAEERSQRAEAENAALREEVERLRKRLENK
jgi:Uma2 family endonuclease